MGRGSPAASITEEEDQIDAVLLDPALTDAVGFAARFGRGGAFESQEAGELIFELELGDAAFAELLAQLEERAIADLLADGDAGAEIPGFRGGRDLEEIQIERATD